MKKSLRVVIIGSFVGLSVLAAIVGVNAWRRLRSPEVVRYVIPSGYRGGLVLCFDPSSEAEWLDGGVLVVRFDHTGHARLQSHRQLNGWYKQQVVDSNGVAVEDDSRPVSPTTLCFRTIGVAGSNQAVLFVLGTADDCDAVMEWSRDPDKLCGGK